VSANEVAPIWNVQDLILMLAFGIEAVQYPEHCDIVSTTSPLFGSDNVMRRVDGTSDAISAQEARFVYSFCVESIIQNEDRLGAVEQPKWKPSVGGTLCRITLEPSGE
jgi:hypothetical protein